MTERITDDRGVVWELTGSTVRCVHVPDDIEAREAERGRRIASDTASSLAEVKAWRDSGCPPIGLAS